MFSKKSSNKGVMTMHHGKPHIRTEVVMLTPIDEDLQVKLEEMMLLGVLDQVIQQMHDKVEDDIAETFEADIESVKVSLRHHLSSRQ